MLTGGDRTKSVHAYPGNAPGQAELASPFEGDTSAAKPAEASTAPGPPALVKCFPPIAVLECFAEGLQPMTAGTKE